jgi:hypothetical protein
VHDRLSPLGKLVYSVEHLRCRAALVSDDAIIYVFRPQSYLGRVSWRLGHPTSSRATTRPKPEALIIIRATSIGDPIDICRVYLTPTSMLTYSGSGCELHINCPGPFFLMLR